LCIVLIGTNRGPKFASALEAGYVSLKRLLKTVAGQCSGIRSSIALLITAIIASKLFLTTRLHRIILLSNTLDTLFCFDALEEALQRFRTPEIFNTDQGSQFTSDAFIEMLSSRGINISMDGRGRWIDNVFVERLWRSVKDEDIYLKAYDSIMAARQGLEVYFDFYNRLRRYQSLDNIIRDEVYWTTLPQQQVAA
jgi:putative transposase